LFVEFLVTAHACVLSASFYRVFEMFSLCFHAHAYVVTSRVSVVCSIVKIPFHSLTLNTICRDEY